MPPSNRVRSIAEVQAEAIAEDAALEEKRLAKEMRNGGVVPEKPTGTLSDINNESEMLLQDLAKDLNKDKFERQRNADAEADFLDSPTGQRLAAQLKAAEKRAAKAEALIEEKGLVLADGTPQHRIPKSSIDPERMKTRTRADGTVEFINPYKNFPVKEIDGCKVQLVGSVPFYNKECTWDDGYRSESQHFVQSDHPNYANAVYCRVRQFKNFDKQIKDAFVVRTDEEIQLFFVI